MFILLRDGRRNLKMAAEHSDEQGEYGAVFVIIAKPFLVTLTMLGIIFLKVSFLL